ncbi:DinB family protein [Hyphobacterium sp.]|uniref:DinB family protein n=1 Tax=Hyphobacterium sp. TaxID=2004662 RepID=UPI00374A25C5
MRDHFRRMAAYNIWANERLYDAVNELPGDRLMAENGAYFGSVFGTLTHILIADRIWMHRLTGAGPTHTDLRDRPFETLGELWMERETMDRRIEAFIDALPESDYAGEAHYTNTRGEPHHLARQIILTHVFNHQTDHRGQVHHMLSVEGVDPPPLDLLYFALPAA